MEYVIGEEYEFSDDQVVWEAGTLNQTSYGGSVFQSKSGNKTEWYDFIREVTITPVEDNKPKVGTTFLFDKEFEPDWKYLGQTGLGWEDEDTLEVISIKEDNNGDTVYIVLNTEPNVLSTAAIMYIETLMKGKSSEEKAIEALNGFNLSMEGNWQEHLIGFIKSGEFTGVTFTGEEQND